MAILTRFDGPNSSATTFCGQLKISLDSLSFERQHMQFKTPNEHTSRYMYFWIYIELVGVWSTEASMLLNPI